MKWAVGAGCLTLSGPSPESELSPNIQKGEVPKKKEVVRLAFSFGSCQIIPWLMVVMGNPYQLLTTVSPGAGL